MTARFVDLGHDGVESPIDGVESRIDRVELRIATCGISIASGDAQAFGEVGAAVAVDGEVPLAREINSYVEESDIPMGSPGGYWTGEGLGGDVVSRRSDALRGECRKQ